MTPAITETCIQAGQSTTLIPVLSLIVAALAVVVGPAVSWKATKRQLVAALQKVWIEEFREEVARLLSIQLSFNALGQDFTNAGPDHEKIKEHEKIKADLNDKMSLSYYKICLLAGEKGVEHDPFLKLILDFMNKKKESKEIVEATSKILKQERCRI
jgi:hypothetical protein